MPHSERLAALADTARAIATDVVAPLAEREDHEARWPAEAMRALADAGLLGLHVPEPLGGRGEGLSGLVTIAEVLASESASTAMCFAMHCVGTAVIAAKATDFQKQAYLEPIARGAHVTTLALSEPGTGAHFYLPETAIEADGDRYRLDGTKSFVTNGGHADSYVVSTRAAADAGGDGAFSCVLVDEGTPGLQWSEPWTGLGMRGNSSRGARLEGVRVPRRNLLGNEGDQLWYVFEVVAPYFLMAMAGTYVGVAQAALDTARVHLGTRRFSHSGELLGSEPVLAHRLGAMYIDVERTRRMVHAAAARADAGEPDALVAVLGCKAAAGDTAVAVANEAMTLCGGMAYRDNSRLARVLRDARAAHVMAPTTDILKTWTGRALLNLPLV
ncbi:acyl-CoA dehydrogenase family protein [Longimicrobium sp.]|uniref:acyl-CoA dehydrogenase family protein n=1 Tax=Longimicrobium sp. TaxID=2029185 RepID=UPI002E37975D|nr:acyl-CoA dehydrogenase family protein [Longimicrobium sp.]HEX6040941.1 acyl-CoA dehydrogenase family protein [Longimicrobium sp.]